MRAIQITRHGPVADLRTVEAPVPSPGPSEVLIEVLAAGINPSDVVSAEGRFPHARLPRILGRDFAGRVVNGPAHLLGAEVWGSGGDLGITRDGSHAAFPALPETAVSRRPANLTPEQAAAAGVPYVTAWSALIDLGGLRSGEWAIVSGAAGAVGQAAVRIARARGARVVALVGNENQRARVGGNVDAVAVLDRGDLAEVVREATGGRGCGLALNGTGASVFQSLVAALAEGGRQVVYSAIGGRETTLDLFQLYRRRHAVLGLNTAALDAAACARILDQVAPLFASGALDPPSVSQSFDLAEAAQAYARVAAGGSGKLVLVP